MRTARKLVLLAAFAVAAAVLAAPPALAQNEPLMHNQAPRLLVQQEVHAGNDVTCPLVTPSPAPNPGPLVTAGGCRVHITSSPSSVVFVLHLTAGGTEVNVGTCGFEAQMRIDVAGEGYLSHQELTGAPEVCNMRACGQLTPPTSEGRAWSFYMAETEVAGQGPREAMILLLCTETLAGQSPFHCEFTIPLSQLSTHRYRAAATDLPEHPSVFPSCEFTGALDFELGLGTTGEGDAYQRVEIRHA